MSDVDDPIGYFLTEQKYYGKSERTLEAYERVLRDFETFLADPKRVPTTPTTPGEAGRRECMAWIHELRGEVARSTVATYASYVHRFYSYLVQVDVLDANPMAIVTDEIDEAIDKDPTRRDVSVQEMRVFVDEITHPLERAIVVTLLKTGIRVGELCNLDLRDLSIDHDSENVNLSSRAALDGRGQTLYVASNTEIPDSRPAANKRKRSTIIPVDEELRRELRRWLAIRPDSYDNGEPLFVSTTGDWGRRLGTQAVRRIVRRHAERQGWHHAEAGAGENVTPHYFRHFFTTHLRDRTGDRGVVKYLRGDVAEDIVDTYTHNWGDRVREVYDQHIYTIC